MYDVVANSAEVVAAVLGIAVTVVAIIVELAATRYNHRITTLFVREPKNIAVLTFFVLTVLLCIWVSATTSPDSGTIWHAITLTMISASLLMLLPYFAYVFAFISPLSVIRHISALAVKALDRPDISRSRHVVIDSVDELQDVLRSAIDAGDRDIAMEAVYGLSGLLERYTDVRSTLSPEWFELHPTIAADPDFVSLEDSALKRIDEARSWLEYKVFSQLHVAVGLSIPRLRDVANLISIRTRHLALADQANSALFETAMMSFNSYLRTTINARDPRTAYYILSQYRMVAEALVADGVHDEVRTIASRLEYYGQLGHQLGQPFILEVCAYDSVQLLERYLEQPESAGRDAGIRSLVTSLLKLDRPFRDEAQQSSSVGVRRAQIRAATALLAAEQAELVGLVVEDLAQESQLSIGALIDELAEVEESHYWELTPRGVNFAYLGESQRAQLPALRELISGR